MKIQSRHETFNIGYCGDTRKFFILSKSNEKSDTKSIGFEIASYAITEALKLESLS